MITKSVLEAKREQYAKGQHKAGYDKAREEMALQSASLAELLMTHRKAGMQVVADWIMRFGKELKGICAADDSAQAIGIIEACKKAGRSDIVVVAAGNSKIGMDAVKAKDMFAITYQSAEADGAVALKAAVDWFNGVAVEPVRYLPKHIITADDADEFLPAQW